MMSHSSWADLPGETPVDLSHLTSKARSQVTNLRELNALEAQNILPVIVKYLSAKPSSRLAPFDIQWVLKVHQEMFREVWQWAGQTRQSEVNIGTPAFNIHGELFGLLKDLAEWPNLAMPLIEQATRLHHRAVAIHPFPNGNGRWSRLLANIWLKRHDHSLVVWPEETIGDASVVRTEYIAAIKAADGGDYDALLGLHERFCGKE